MIIRSLIRPSSSGTFVRAPDSKLVHAYGECIHSRVHINSADQSLFLCQPRIQVMHFHIHTKLRIENGSAILWPRVSDSLTMQELVTAVMIK
jgi:hypothetical protein